MKMGSNGYSETGKRKQSVVKLVAFTFAGVVFGFAVGLTFTTRPSNSLNALQDLFPNQKVLHSNIGRGSIPSDQNENNTHKKIWVPSNPKGAETLPPGIVVSESDLYLHKLLGNPREDLMIKPKYLVCFTVGYAQKNNVDAAVKKFSKDFTIVLFHYDGKTVEWNEFEWSKKAIHISVERQTKWWYAKRFLHPDIVAPYDYLFIWDEDLGVEHFDAEEYLKLVKKHGLEISQPGLEPYEKMTWQMTARRDDVEAHKQAKERPGGCRDPNQPPCAGFIEIMAPVFTKTAWRCVWHMIQNDLIHGWGLDLAFGRCVEPAHEKIGVIDAQWIVHQQIPSLGGESENEKGKSPRKEVRERSQNELRFFKKRLEQAEKEYYQQLSNGAINP